MKNVCVFLIGVVLMSMLVAGCTKDSTILSSSASKTQTESGGNAGNQVDDDGGGIHPDDGEGDGDKGK